MKSGPFIATVSAAYRVEEKTVTVFARYLKEAGHMTSTIRGSNAPHMQPRDLAALTIALLATERPARCIEAFEAVAKMQMGSPEQFRFIEQGVPNPDHTFLDLMTYLCDPALPFTDTQEFKIEITGTNLAIVKRDSLTLAYIDRVETKRLTAIYAETEPNTGSDSAFQQAVEASPMNGHGIVTTREIAFRTLQIVKTIAFDEIGN